MFLPFMLRKHSIIAFTLALASLAVAQAPRPTPPPEPDVKPIVSAPVDADSDRTGIANSIETAVISARNELARKDADAAAKSKAVATLDERVSVELVFSRQITQGQIDAFLKAGGLINRIYSNVSYGWTGSIRREDAMNLPQAMGPTLLGVVEDMPMQLHMDEAGRTGRVRPTVWNMGFKGQSTGPNRITIAILDSGVDATHTDLAGRMAFWADTTSDSLSTPQDLGHHGSHVTGIALGTGAASGVAPSEIRYTDIGQFPTTGNNFFPSPIHVPVGLSSFSWNAQLFWDNNSGYTARFGLLGASTSNAWNNLVSDFTTINSPVSTSVSGVVNPNVWGTNRYSSYPSLTSSQSGVTNYAVVNRVDYVGIGDGYNLLSGVAPNAAWAGIKVFRNDGAGYSSNISAGLDEAVANRVANQIKVLNMSLGVIGSPGYNVTQRNKTNTAVQNGIVVTVSAGNDGRSSSGSAGEIDDPGRSHYAITVASASDVNRLTAYSSHGFTGPGHEAEGDEDMKPDIMAPGGSSSFESSILSVDSNTADCNSTAGLQIADQAPNDYKNIQGTSMAAPYIAGCVALMIDAMQSHGYVWKHTGPDALEQVLTIKAMLLMTATETNQTREAGSSLNPTLNRGAKDINEGFGMVNGDAAVEMLANAIRPAASLSAADSFGNNPWDRRCWARKVSLTANEAVRFTLEVPAGADYDLYLYDNEPDQYGNPTILKSSVQASADTDETIEYTSPSNRQAFVVVKRVAGAGNWAIGAMANAALWPLY